MNGQLDPLGSSSTLSIRPPPFLRVLFFLPITMALLPFLPSATPRLNNTSTTTIRHMEALGGMYEKTLEMMEKVAQMKGEGHSTITIAHCIKLGPQTGRIIFNEIYRRAGLDRLSFSEGRSERLRSMYFEDQIQKYILLPKLL
ncbi:hypothetical protein EV361DRAFT_170512 [Lentinula raphanica]|uniref:Uncharacterized protein n=1 Tax=Lentinula raphanica TaxID=153919 RepID=A0AA38P5G0_9AGAR|nr:hypothetical protein F5878DRAFT_259910 [Lentinula raphanica]KAJ3972053.1 hypothetical protein EV361DRAFT_170512 [Lentinula raphanica]